MEEPVTELFSKNQPEKKKKRHVKHRKSCVRGKQTSSSSSSQRPCCEEDKESSPSPLSSPSSASIAKIAQKKSFNCNLDRFLESTCPVVQAQRLAKTCASERCCTRQQHHDLEPLPYFTLGDLWDSLDEWSVYGRGVPISLKGREPVVQYYVPYLSALQLYTRSNESRIRCQSNIKPSGNGFLDDDNDTVPDCRYCQCGNADAGHDCMSGAVNESSDCCCGCGKFRRIQEHDQIAFEDAVDKDWDPSLLFEYFELAPPYARTPLSDKISYLAKSFPELRSLRSVDLLPASWISIAWYPIYRIPTGPTLRDLDACFLTFHGLSTSLRDGELWGIVKPSSCPMECTITLSSSFKHPIIHLKAFGLAHYKLRGSIWTSVGNPERRHAASMYRCAESWLKHLHVGHPDFDFFQSQNPIPASQ